MRVFRPWWSVSWRRSRTVSSAGASPGFGGLQPALERLQQERPEENVCRDKGASLLLGVTLRDHGQRKDRVPQRGSQAGDAPVLWRGPAGPVPERCLSERDQDHGEQRPERDRKE